MARAGRVQGGRQERFHTAASAEEAQAVPRCGAAADEQVQAGIAEKAAAAEMAAALAHLDRDKAAVAAALAQVDRDEADALVDEKRLAAEQFAADEAADAAEEERVAEEEAADEAAGAAQSSATKGVLLIGLTGRIREVVIEFEGGARPADTVMQQTGISRSEVIKVLVENDNDVGEAIMVIEEAAEEAAAE